MVEQSAVNRKAAGSNPALSAMYTNREQIEYVYKMPLKCTRRHASFVLWRSEFESCQGLFYNIYVVTIELFTMYML